MRFLHTSDWHLGKTLRGRSRLDEQRLVLAEVVAVAREHEVDAVLVAGDLFDTVAPAADATGLALQTLLALRDTGAQVIAIAGNHDNAAMFRAWAPLLREVGVTLAGHVRPADAGGVVEFRSRGGEDVVVALLPFLSQRYAVRAADLLAATPAEQAASYDQRVRDILAHLTGPFRDDTVNLVLAHLTVTGGELGGGERAAHSIFEYHVPAQAFGGRPHYVALGHLHRYQQVPAPAPVVYCGSPLAVDFGEQDNTQMVCVVDARPGTPATWTPVPITSAMPLRTVRGTVVQLQELAGDVGDAYLRVVVCEAARAGLREDVMAALPNTLVIQVDPQYSAVAQRPSSRTGRVGRPATELFDDYCAERAIDDDRVRELFRELLDEVQATPQPSEEVR